MCGGRSDLRPVLVNVHHESRVPPFRRAFGKALLDKKSLTAYKEIVLRLRQHFMLMPPSNTEDLFVAGPHKCRPRFGPPAAVTLFAVINYPCDILSAASTIEFPRGKKRRFTTMTTLFLHPSNVHLGKVGQKTL